MTLRLYRRVLNVCSDAD